MTVTSGTRIESQPKISRLHQEILQYIFSLNARPCVDIGQEPDGDPQIIALRDDSSPGPLLPIRYASQVCRQWRTTILSSPTLRANALDLNFLTQKNGNWRNEVLKRTGESPLTVIADICFDNAWDGFPYSFLLKILDVHWHRIRTLFVCIHPISEDSDAAIPVRDGLWHAVNRPAPNLKFCTIVNMDAEYHSPNTALFSGESPQLRSITFQGFRVKLSGPWLFNVRRLFLLSTHSYSVNHILQGLFDMPLLEELTLEMDPSIQGKVVHKSVVELPNLARLVIYNSTTWLTHIVNSIVPRQGCSLIHIVGDEAKLPIKLESLDQQGKAYATFLHKYSKASDITSISYSLHMDSDLPRLRIKGATSDMSVSQQETDRIDIKYDLSRFHQWSGGPIPHFVAGALSSCDLQNVKELEFLLDEEFEEITGESISVFLSFFRALSSVDVMISNSFALAVVSLVQEASSKDVIILPLLRTIKLTSEEFEPDLLAEFVSQRRQAGVPVESIYTESHGNEYEDFSSTLRELEDIGIMVVWKESPREDKRGSLKAT